MNRIVGGTETAAHEYPWIVAISENKRLYCGGSLISHNYILTAAHCVSGLKKNIKNILVCRLSQPNSNPLISNLC